MGAGFGVGRRAPEEYARDNRGDRFQRTFRRAAADEAEGREHQKEIKDDPEGGAD